LQPEILTNTSIPEEQKERRGRPQAIVKPIYIANSDVIGHIKQDLKEIQEFASQNPIWKDTSRTSIFRLSKKLPQFIMTSMFCKTKFKSKNIETVDETYRESMKACVEFLLYFEVELDFELT